MDTFLRMARHQFVEPSAMLSAVRQSGRGQPATTCLPPSTSAQPDSFVGREEEMAQLEAHLTAALNGRGRIVLISGEAGYGKTMLMTEFARHAMDRYPNLIAALWQL
ncbi:MAG: ATP-binding protein [Anaerolineae bacterium]|nr:ATP-binding protein [Anaerolineae bacterium]